MEISGKLTPPELSDYLMRKYRIKRTPATLAKLRCLGGGPPFRKAGNFLRAPVLYDQPGADEWAAALIGEPLTSTAQFSRAARSTAA
jgi:hypothetical protein